MTLGCTGIGCRDLKPTRNAQNPSSITLNIPLILNPFNSPGLTNQLPDIRWFRSLQKTDVNFRAQEVNSDRGNGTNFWNDRLSQRRCSNRPLVYKPMGWRLGLGWLDYVGVSRDFEISRGLEEKGFLDQRWWISWMGNR